MSYLIDIHLIFIGAVFIAVRQNLIGKGRFCARISKVEDIEIKDLDSVVKCKGELKGAVSLNDSLELSQNHYRYVKKSDTFGFRGTAMM